jgi:hypothetical protein
MALKIILTVEKRGAGVLRDERYATILTHPCKNKVAALRDEVD